MSPAYTGLVVQKMVKRLINPKKGTRDLMRCEEATPIGLRSSESSRVTPIGQTRVGARPLRPRFGVKKNFANHRRGLKPYLSLVKCLVSTAYISTSFPKCHGPGFLFLRSFNIPGSWSWKVAFIP